MSKYLSIERPDQEVTIDFLSFHPSRMQKVEGVSVTVKLEWHPHRGEATLYVCAVDDGTQEILLDEMKAVSVTALDKEEEDR